MHTTRTRAGFVVGLALLLAACGGETTPPKATPNPSAPVGSIERFCAEMAKYNAAALRTDATKEELAKGIELARVAISAAKANAPADIKADASIVADTYVPFAQAIAAVGYDYQKLTPAQRATLSGKPFTTALKRVGDYRRVHCPS